MMLSFKCEAYAWKVGYIDGYKGVSKATAGILEHDRAYRKGWYLGVHDRRHGNRRRDLVMENPYQKVLVQSEMFCG